MEIGRIVAEFIKARTGARMKCARGRALVESLEGRTLLSTVSLSLTGTTDGLCMPVVVRPVEGTVVGGGTIFLPGQGTLNPPVFGPGPVPIVDAQPVIELVVDPTEALKTVVTLTPPPTNVRAGESLTLAGQVQLESGGAPARGYLSFFDVTGGSVLVNSSGHLVVSGARILGHSAIDAEGKASIALTLPVVSRTLVYGGSYMGVGPQPVLDRQGLLPGQRSVVAVYTEWDPYRACSEPRITDPAPVPEYLASASAAAPIHSIMPTGLTLKTWGAATKTHAPVFTATVTNAAGEMFGLNPANPAIIGTIQSAEAKGRVKLVMPTWLPQPEGSSGAATFANGILLTSSMPRVSNAVPTGHVVFMDGERVLARVALDANGTATYRPAVAASYNVRAVYEGDGTFEGSEAAGVSIQSTATPVEMKLTMPSVVKQGSAFNVSVKVTTTVLDVVKPTGSIDLYIGSRKIGTLELGSKANSLKVKMRAGFNKIRAVYRGDGFCAGAETVGRMWVSSVVRAGK